MWQKIWESTVLFGLFHGNNQVESSSFLMLTVELLKWVSKKKKKKKELLKQNNDIMIQHRWNFPKQKK